MGEGLRLEVFAEGACARVSSATLPDHDGAAGRPAGSGLTALHQRLRLSALHPTVRSRLHGGRLRAQCQSRICRREKPAGGVAGQTGTRLGSF